MVFQYLIFATVILNGVQSENILFLLPIATKSETNLFSPLAEALSAKGHEVTYFSPTPPSIKSPKLIHYNIVTPMGMKDFFGQESSGFHLEARAEGKLMEMINYNMSMMTGRCHEIYQSKIFKEKVLDKRNHFHLVIMSGFFNNCLNGALYLLQAPFILFTSMPAMASTTDILGNPMPPSFIPISLLNFTHEMNFDQRVLNFGFNEFSKIMFGELMTDKYFDPIYRQYLGQDLPSSPEIEKNVSMVFMNSHYALTFPRPLMPDLVEVGGIHCREAKKLDQKFEYFINGAGKEGIIFVSFGSIIVGSSMPESYRKFFIDVFSRLKQRVIWKWETEEMANLPKNVMLTKWAPQQDILGHKNTKLFISHGGLLSTQEATYHGVPILGVPFFADQDLNMNQAVQAGFAHKLEILGLTEEKLEAAINKALDSKEMNVRINEISRVFKDQPMSSIDKAVFWSEYVMRFKGAKHLRSPARNLNYFQFHSYDSIAFIFCVLAIILYVTYRIIFFALKTIMGILFSSPPPALDMKKRN